MQLETLKVSSLRNIDYSHLSFSPRFNVFCGPNGSGKSSLLESVYFLGYARSFRTYFARPVVQDKAEKSIIYAEFKKKERLIAVGIERFRQGGMTVRVSGQPVPSILELVRQIPIQLLSPDSYKLLEEGPKYRRQYLDWGVFHVEPSFINVWQRYQRALKQRNAALRSGASQQHVGSWDQILVVEAQALDQMRQAYLESLQPFVAKILIALFETSTIELSYLRGWPNDCSFSDALTRKIMEDRRLGYTSVGPHRAEVAFRMSLGLAKNHLSRGQQKLLVCALLLAQVQHLTALTGKEPLLLIDDLCSELDRERSAAVLNLLAKLRSQVFLTTIDLGLLDTFTESSESAVFHVEHGAFSSAMPTSS